MLVEGEVDDSSKPSSYFWDRQSGMPFDASIAVQFMPPLPPPAEQDADQGRYYSLQLFCVDGTKPLAIL